jgi:DNA-binding MarR family transcriptional regulator
MNRKSGAARSLSAQSFTEKQGQYLAFIYTYSHMFRRPPAETDMQRHFQVSPPSVHQMIVTLERNGLIQRQPGVARSIQILVAPENLPTLIGSKSTSHNHGAEVLVPRHSDYDSLGVTG